MAEPVNVSIVEHFQSLEDPRIERSKKHRLIDILVIALCMANLEGASLKKTGFFRSRLPQADLKRIDGTEASFVQADLKSVDLTDAKLTSANLSGADLTGASLTRTDISGAAFESRDKSGNIELDENKKPISAQITIEQLREACADPANPPHLPANEEFKNLILAKCPEGPK